MMMRLLWLPVVLVVLLMGWYIVAPRTVAQIDGIPCQESGSVRYHVHAFLSVVDRGRIQHPPAGVGIRYDRFCLYWLHTHDNSGVIHIEAPHRITPTLGAFFAIWGQPLSNRQVAGFRVRRGERMRVYLGRSRFSGDPSGIHLRNHTTITVEIGPPFIPPVPGEFAGL
jgi:hypothetical protein